VLARSDQIGGPSAARSSWRQRTRNVAVDGSCCRDTGPGRVGLVPNPVIPHHRARHTPRRPSAPTRRPVAVWAFGLRWSFALRWFAALGIVRRDGPPFASSLRSGSRHLPELAQLARSNGAVMVDPTSPTPPPRRAARPQVGIEPSSVFVIHTGISQDWLTAPRAERCCQ
jgi:hypothetical protein